MSSHPLTVAILIAIWFKKKYRLRAEESGYFKTATAMRKQGIPLDITRAILFGRT